ncbi:MAG: zinc-dependent alcohol dehydrogenase family protein [Anaerolineales bacterium]
MRALELRKPQAIEQEPLRKVERASPTPGTGQLRVRVQSCGVCRTDLHLIEGELAPPMLPVVPGHQIAGIVAEVGRGVRGWKVGDRVGVPWLHRACGACDACRRGDENLCPEAEFTGLNRDGGYAEETLAEADFALRPPEGWAPESIAPLLCAGIIGYRSLRKTEVRPGDRLGLIGFGASAHLALQIARHWGCPTAVFTRGPGHRRLAMDLGAAWAGGIDDAAPWALDGAVLFAPSGSLVRPILERLRPGGTLAVNAIHMSPIPEMPYRVLYGERTVRSVAHATRQDGIDLLELAVKIPLRAVVKTYPLAEANQALADMKHSRLDAAAVLVP